MTSDVGRGRSAYQSLPSEARGAAVVLLLEREPMFKAAVIRRFVLRAGGFRPETLRQWPAKRLAREVVARRLEKPADEGYLLQLYYTDVRPEIQAAFFDLAGVPHEGARVKAPAKPPFAEPEVVLAAAKSIHERFGEEGWQYLRCLSEHASKDWPGITNALTDILAGGNDSPQPLARNESPGTEGPSGSAVEAQSSAVSERIVRLSPPGEGGLHLLDDVVTLAVINSSNGVDEALPQEAAERLVAELVKVNGQRHQSWFAAGLYRSLIADSGISPGTGDAQGAKRWFLAGRVVGLLRLNDLAGIVSVFDQEPACRQLGDDGLGPSHEAAAHIFTALWTHERFGDAVAFLHPAAIGNSPLIGRTVLDLATRLLTLIDWEHARPAFDLLGTGLDHRRNNGDESLEPLRPTIERRQAHCRRLAGEFQAACAILQPMVDDEDGDPELRGMMLVDIALMDAGFRELAEVTLPMERADAIRVARALDGVEEHLERAVVLDPDGAAHARYLLGVRSLLRENGQEGRLHLERALSAFRSRPEVYTRQGLLAQAELFEALAVCLDHDQAPSRVQAASHRLMLSTAEELRIPGWMLESVLTGIAFADQDLATRFADLLLRERPQDVVEQFVSLADEIKPVAVALAGVAMDLERPMARRMQAAHRAIPALIEHGELDTADELLSMLCEEGLKGVAREEALALLADRGGLLQLRDADDLAMLEAQLRLSAGDVGTAISIWNKLALQTLAAETPWQRAEVAAIVERLEELPDAADLAASLRERLRRAEEHLEPPTPPSASLTVKLLVVGGDETQSRYNEEIRQILRVEAPHVIPTFVPTGWGSNWGDTARSVVRQLEQADGIVMHYFIRTMFGRKVRKAAGCKPWRSVGGHGRDGILRGIYACAAAVAQGRAAT